MYELDRHQRFINLRCRGLSFARIAQEMKVSKPTLLAWSRKYRFAKQNFRAIGMGAGCSRLMASSEKRPRKPGDQPQGHRGRDEKNDQETVKKR
jgi:hypothetical protein